MQIQDNGSCYFKYVLQNQEKCKKNNKENQTKQTK